MTSMARELAEISTAASVVTVGNFDGVHRGHQVLLRRAVDAAEELGVRSAAVTFEPHPAAVVSPGRQPLRLQPLEARIEALAARGVDLVAVLPFTAEVAAWSPESFVEQVLVHRLEAVRVVVGTNFRYGHRAAGDVVTLSESGEQHGFGVEAVTLLDLEGDPISSTALRNRIAEGDVRWAMRALGRPFELEAPVVHGEGRGRTIGVPTANLDVDAELIVPGNGVYACWVEVDDVVRAAVTNVGVRPTFDGETRSVETHLIDAADELYGAVVRMRFIERIRAERRFDGVDDLVAQIQRDIEVARGMLGDPPG